MTDFYAKPDQTYREHLEAAYLAWKETITGKRPLIERVAKKYGFPVERFMKGSLLSIVFHDIGKMTEQFQEMMAEVRQGRSSSKFKNYRHELISFVYATEYWKLLNNNLSSIPIEALAVAGHHKPLDSDLTSFRRERMALVPTVLKAGIEEALSIAKELFKREGWMFPSVKKDPGKVDPYKILAGLVSTGLLNKGIERDGAEKVRVFYFLLKGILHYADWHGSGNAPVRYSITKNPSYIIDDLSSRCKTKGIPYEGLRPFQRICSNHLGHLVVVAPTGSGKTEAALLWALNNVRELGGAKIIYLLPTMVTANSIWQRVVDFFDEKNVGLTHSTANLFLQKDSLEDEEDQWENRRNYLFNQAFIKPITVGTVDQLLTTGFNSGKWVLKEANASNSVIIIDEIHAYDGWTLGLIISTIRHFSSFGSRFMLMSATLPLPLQKIFLKELETPKIVKEKTLFKAKRSKYFVVDDVIENASMNIETAVSEGKRVLVVVNTVGLCQTLSQKLSKLNPICYHSQFILKDRKTIESKISRGNLVIATQVVEVSLDIDYDWLFTECAPPDALVQRAGRVNRYRDSQRDSRVYIFRASEKSAKIYNPINNPTLLKRSFKAFKDAPQEMSEDDLTNLVEAVYRDYKLEETDAFKEAINQYRISQSKRSVIFDSRLKEDGEVTRQTKYETSSVIPKCFKDEVLKMKPEERRWYEIKLPLWYVLKYREEEKGIMFCDVDYDSNIGAMFQKGEQVVSMII